MPINKTKVKKDGLQQYRVRVNYTDANGKYKQVERTAYGKAEAQELERRLIKELTGTQAQGSLTLSELFEEYKAYKKHEVRQTTVQKSNSVLRTHVIPELGAIPLDSLTTQVLMKWRLSINEKALAVSTKNNIYREFHALLNYAVRMKYLQANPLNDVGGFREVYFKMPEEKLHFYTAEQFLSYIQCMRRDAKSMTGWGIYVFFNIAFYTGMRKGEINALKWSDIEGNYINVRRSVSQKVKGTSLVETPPKNKSSYRKLQIPTPLQNVLDEHKVRQQQDARWTPEYRVCGGIGVISDTAIENANRAAGKAAHLPHIRVHDFRHTHASLLINEGISIQEVARRLGHADVKMTWNVYGHLYPREEERAINVLNKIVF